MATSVVRIDVETHGKLKEIAAAEGRPIGQMVSRLVEQYETEQFWANVRTSVERSRADPEAWAGYQREVRFFEGGSMDGLSSEGPYYTAEEEAAIYAEND